MGTRPILNTTFHNFSLGLKYPLALLLVRLTFRPDTLSKQIDHWAETILRWFTCVLHDTILSVFFQFIFKGFNLSVEFGEAWPGSTSPTFFLLAFNLDVLVICFQLMRLFYQTFYYWTESTDYIYML